jgi:hypothetical protein
MRVCGVSCNMQRGEAFSSSKDILGAIATTGESDGVDTARTSFDG